MWKQAKVRVPYLGGLDGLRAIAVMSVLLYHADVSQLKGGFLGVEVFFVISGYLITAILLAQWRNDRRIDLKTFYIRRARRLLPALFLVLVGVLVISVIFLPDEVATLRGDVFASFGYVTNWFFVIHQKSYFEAAGRPSLVEHLWSLAVEEQFYLIWPVLFAFGMRTLGRRRLLVAILVGAVASTVLMAVLYHPGVDPSRVYYGTDTRAAALLIGAALAMVWAPFRLKRKVGRSAPVMLDVLGGAALAVLLGMLVVTDIGADSLYRGGFLKVSIVTAVVIAVVAHPAAHLGKLLAIRPLRWIGLRSYGIYLFHWPVYQLTRPQLDVPITGFPLLALRLAITFGLATVSYRWFETPIRNGALKKGLDRWRETVGVTRLRVSMQWLASAAVLLTALSLLMVVVVRAQPAAVPDYLVAAASSDGLPPAPGQSDAGLPPGPGVVVPPGSTKPGTSVAPATSAPTIAPATTTTVAATAGGSGDPTTVAPTTVPDTTATTTPAATRRVTFIGDSVMLGAAAALKAGIDGQVFVDARVGRQVSECLSILHVWHDQGLLGDVVVVHIGNNGTFSEDQFNEMRDILAAVPKVIFVNNKVPRSWEDGNNAVIAAGAASMPNAVLIDWRGLTDPKPEIFYSDGMHLKPDGAAYYTSLINADL